MKIRNARRCAQGQNHCFCNGCGVLLLNLQPEAKSEEFVVARWHQVSCGGCFVRVGVDFSATVPIVSAVVVSEKSEAKHLSSC